jgi:hypothetical protein
MRTNLLLKSALGVSCALAIMVALTSQGAHSPETLAKEGIGLTGGVDPHGDSWVSIRNSFQQFENPAFVLRLLLSLTLAAACASAIAWRPGGLQRIAPAIDFEERKTLIVLGVVGAVIAELSGTSSTLAFVIFGIGALVRFRTLLDNPRATGKAILAVVIGLSCGMGSWTMAVFVTVFSWGLLLALDSKISCNLTITAGGKADMKQVREMVQALLVSHQCRVQNCKFSKSKNRLRFVLNVPAQVDRDELETEVKDKLPAEGEFEVELKVV